MAWYWYVLIGAGSVVLLVLLWKGRSWLARQTPSVASAAGGAPSLTSKQAEEEREEVKEDLAEEKEAIKEKYDDERKAAEKWLSGEKD